MKVFKKKKPDAGRLRVPASWSVVTIGRFQAIHEALREYITANEQPDVPYNIDVEKDYSAQLDRSISLLATACGVSEERILDLTQDQFLRAMKAISFLNELPHVKAPPRFLICRNRSISRNPAKGVFWLKRWFPSIFYPSMRVEKITAGQLIDLNAFLRRSSDSNIIDHLHEILATLLLPSRFLFFKCRYDGSRHKELSLFLKENMTVAQAYPIALFFWNLSNALIPHIRLFLTRKMEEKLMTAKNLMEELKEEMAKEK